MSVPQPRDAPELTARPLWHIPSDRVKADLGKELVYTWATKTGDKTVKGVCIGAEVGQNCIITDADGKEFLAVRLLLRLPDGKQKWTNYFPDRELVADD